MTAIIDFQPGWEKQARYFRDIEITKAARNGVPVVDLARKYGVQRNRIYRIVERIGPMLDATSPEAIRRRSARLFFVQSSTEVAWQTCMAACERIEKAVEKLHNSEVSVQ